MHHDTIVGQVRLNVQGKDGNGNIYHTQTWVSTPDDMAILPSHVANAECKWRLIN